MTTLRASIGILILIATLANGIRRFERDNSNQQQQQQQQQQVTTKQLQQEQPESEITFGLNNIPDDNIVEIPVNAKEGDFKLEQLKVAEKDDEFQPAQIRSPSGQSGQLPPLQGGRDITRQGYPPQGYPSQDYPSQDYPSQGYPSQGYPSQGYPPQQGFPPGIVNPGTDISSVSDARLELAPGSDLSSPPGQLSNVVFLLMNLGEAKYFYISVNEQQGGGGYDPQQQITYPGQVPQAQSQFLNGLSEQRPYLRRNETRNIVISLRVPQNAFVGTNKTITLEVQPDGVAGSSNALLRRFYFTVSTQRPSFTDRTGPYCTVVEDTRSTKCAGVINNPTTCRQNRWSGKFEFTDNDSGLRTLTGRDWYDRQLYDVFWSYNNFIIGSKLPAQYSFQASCCINSYTVAGVDLAGNEEVCVAGEGATQVKFGSLEITITVVVIVLAFVIVIGIIIFCCIRKRRNVELAEMRAQPQAR